MPSAQLPSVQVQVGFLSHLTAGRVPRIPEGVIQEGPHFLCAASHPGSSSGRGLPRSGWRCEDAPGASRRSGLGAMPAGALGKCLGHEAPTLQEGWALGRSERGSCLERLVGWRQSAQSWGLLTVVVGVRSEIPSDPMNYHQPSSQTRLWNAPSPAQPLRTLGAALTGADTQPLQGNSQSYAVG